MVACVMMQGRWVGVVSASSCMCESSAQEFATQEKMKISSAPVKPAQRGCRWGGDRTKQAAHDDRLRSWRLMPTTLIGLVFIRGYLGWAGNVHHSTGALERAKPPAKLAMPAAIVALGFHRAVGS